VSQPHAPTGSAVADFLITAAAAMPARPRRLPTVAFARTPCPACRSTATVIRRGPRRRGTLLERWHTCRQCGGPFRSTEMAR
jgi:hypothetical protein